MGIQQLTGQVRELRRRGYTPKQIARSLGLPPATSSWQCPACTRQTGAVRAARRGAVGSAGVTIFFAFFGWEAITHLSAEFRDPARDVPAAPR